MGVAAAHATGGTLPPLRMAVAPSQIIRHSNAGRDEHLLCFFEENVSVFGVLSVPVPQSIEEVRLFRERCILVIYSTSMLKYDQNTSELPVSVFPLLLTATLGT